MADVRWDPGTQHMPVKKTEVLHHLSRCISLSPKRQDGWISSFKNISVSLLCSSITPAAQVRQTLPPSCTGEMKDRGQRTPALALGARGLECGRIRHRSAKHCSCSVPCLLGCWRCTAKHLTGWMRGEQQIRNLSQMFWCLPSVTLSSCKVVCPTHPVWANWSPTWMNKTPKLQI